jgi:hypothetical protein
MTNYEQNATETQCVASRENVLSTEAKLSTDQLAESIVSRIPANWAWANSRSGYDWMDSHFPFTDLG